MYIGDGAAFRGFRINGKTLIEKENYQHNSEMTGKTARSNPMIKHNSAITSIIYCLSIFLITAANIWHAAL